jgi:hypothetical protein
MSSAEQWVAWLDDGLRNGMAFGRRIHDCCFDDCLIPLLSGVLHFGICLGLHFDSMDLVSDSSYLRTRDGFLSLQAGNQLGIYGTLKFIKQFESGGIVVGCDVDEQRGTNARLWVQPLRFLVSGGRFQQQLEDQGKGEKQRARHTHRELHNPENQLLPFLRFPSTSSMANKPHSP